MKVIVAVAGRFHAFHMAAQLFKKNLLGKLVTTENKRKSDLFPASKIKRFHSMSLLSAIEKGAYFFSFLEPIFPFVYWKKNISFDKKVARFLTKEEADVFLFFTNQGLASVRSAKKQNMITVADCGSAYITFQKNIVKEEYKIHNLAPSGPYKLLDESKGYDAKIIKRGIQEFEEADYILVGSTFAKTTFPQKLQKKIRVIGYGYDPSLFYPEKKQDDVFRIVYVGRLELQKGVQYLLQAFCELNLSNTELYLVGSVDPGFHTFLEKYKHPNIKLQGHVNQNDLYKEYSKGSIFVQPSIQDGFSMVILEAMACGLPVITTTHTAGTDVVRDEKEGFVIPIRDVSILKEKINYLYDNPKEREKMATNAMKRVKEFTWDKYGERLASTLASLKK